MLVTTAQTEGYALLTGHVVEALRSLPERSVQCVVTSPPYWGLRDYQTTGQVWGGDETHDHVWDRQDDAGCECGAWKGELGHEPSMELFVEHLVLIFRELRRVLRDDGICWLNLGDTFLNRVSGRVQSTRIAGDQLSVARTSSGHWDIKNKDLVGVPWAVAVALRRDGWHLRQDVIWSKAGGNCPKCHYRIEKGSGLPEPVTDRFVRSHEHVFLLTKKPKYFFDYEGAKEKDSIANRRDVIHIPAAKFRGSHFATMATELARILVRAGTSKHGACAACGAPWKRRVEKGAPLERLRRESGANADGGYDGEAIKDYAAVDVQNPSDVKRRILNAMRERITVGWEPTCACENAEIVPCIVLDPFSGAATTGVAAVELKCNYIGIEIDEKCNVEIAGPRLEAVKLSRTLTINEISADSGVYHGCAESLLQRIPSGIVRMVLTDPPYNVSRKNNFHTMGRTGIDFEWDGDFDQEEWLRHVDRVLTPGGSLVIWNDYKVLGLIAHVLIDMGYDVKRPLTWLKNNPMPRNTTRLPTQATEHGLWAVKPGAKWIFNKRGANETFVFRYPLPRGRKGRPRHDAKKPDDMYGEIIEILSNPGELIVDPFCGGGTLAYAAEKRGRRHISIDEDEKWITETKARWDEAKSEG